MQIPVCDHVINIYITVEWFHARQTRGPELVFAKNITQVPNKKGIVFLLQITTIADAQRSLEQAIHQHTCKVVTEI